MIQLPHDHDVSYEAGEARFSTYLRATGGHHVKASRLYMWNLSVSARWWGPLAYLEVALRNKLHDRLAESVGRKDWWLDEGLHMSEHLMRNIADAQRYARSQLKSGSPSADDVVAASSFGLWTSVLHKDNAQGLWRDHLQAGFDGRVKRGPLYDNAYKLKKLRDRIAHHEPIFAENQGQHLRELDVVLAAIHEDLPSLVGEWFPGLRCAIDGYDEALRSGTVDL
ncbi:hypothetical protein [uncultured Corynebacterium sp.]|uniref:hypothetical protein n=1 Tax=uncultured Corynebacterium sp. TaxID=159447 RepID=UPI0025E97158|nr:hypothetical protein [uncultured Corynebacterium sp.]